MKKILSLIITFVLIAGMFIVMSICSFAAPTPFITDPLSTEEQATFIKNVPVEKIDHMEGTTPIQCFDVNENKMILVLFKRSSAYAVCVYNSNFEFQYGFTFEAEGTVACEWSGNNIMIYFVRGDVYAELDENGQWQELNRVQNSFENNSLRNDLLYHKKSVTIDDTTYKIQNDLGVLNYVQLAHNFSQLVKTDVNGNEIILYDVNSEQLIRTILVLTFIIAFVSIVLFTLLKPIFKEMKKKSHK